MPASPWHGRTALVPPHEFPYWVDAHCLIASVPNILGSATDMNGYHQHTSATPGGRPRKIHEPTAQISGLIYFNYLPSGCVCIRHYLTWGIPGLPDDSSGCLQRTMWPIMAGSTRLLQALMRTRTKAYRPMHGNIVPRIVLAIRGQAPATRHGALNDGTSEL
ncbi:hypothetical protein OBBRIDRAFT_191799 [Obba rivulosa]|uniref:Uncharacterized protein n=1 Tax=Obba rivulosa TaxID=1052685 RepID=A0A8E2ALM1_9APHY|nr:hypothetical protein OBBRIDRAFT_191799 [Obba rivulosa]